MISLPYDITCVDAQYIQPGVACLYLLEQNSKLCIIETGTSNSIPHVLETLDKLGRSPDDVEYIIPTHIHLDHAGGAGGLMQLCKNAQLVIHPRGAYHMAHPEKLQAGTIAVYGEEAFKNIYGSLVPVAEDRIIEAPDNFEIDFYGRTLRFLDTPGHALHHFCVYDEASHGIFTGDTFGISYKAFDSGNDHFVFATTTPVHFDPDALLASIDRLLSLKPEIMYLTHFCAIELNPDDVKQLKDSIHAFVEIAHSSKDDGEQRAANIERNTHDWLVEQSYQINSTMELEQRRKYLSADAHLNAQGLEIWLKRMEKNSQ